jgi:hypothetical protein
VSGMVITRMRILVVTSVLSILTVATFYLLFLDRTVSIIQTTMAPLTHIVIFQFKSDTDEAQKTAIAEAFLALRNQCLSPANFTSPGTPYILNIIAGSNNSPEVAAKVYQVSSIREPFLRSSFSNIRSPNQHAYIVTFASVQHRDYYIDYDPAHIAFKSLVGPLLEKVVVTDFIDGVWN